MGSEAAKLVENNRYSLPRLRYQMNEHFEDSYHSHEITGDYTGREDSRSSYSLHVSKEGEEQFGVVAYMNLSTRVVEYKEDDEGRIERLKRDGFREVKARVDLGAYEAGGKYEVDVGEDRSSSLKDPEIQAKILSALENVKELLPRGYTLEGFDVDSFCWFLGIDEDCFYKSVNALSDAKSIDTSGDVKESLENGRMFITPRGTARLVQLESQTSSPEERDRIAEFLASTNKIPSLWRSIDVRVLAANVNGEWCNLQTRCCLEYLPPEEIEPISNLPVTDHIGAWQEILPVGELSSLLHAVESGELEVGGNLVKYMNNQFRKDVTASPYRFSEPDWHNISYDSHASTFGWSARCLMATSGTMHEILQELPIGRDDLDNNVQSLPRPYDGLLGLARSVTRFSGDSLHNYVAMVHVLAPFRARFDTEACSLRNGECRFKLDAMIRPLLDLCSVGLPDKDGHSTSIEVQKEEWQKGKEGGYVYHGTAGLQDAKSVTLLLRVGGQTVHRIELNDSGSESEKGAIGTVGEKSIVVTPIFHSRDFDQRTTYAFVLMPFCEDWSDRIWRHIKEIVTGAGLECERADDLYGQNVLEDIWRAINEASVIIADTTGRNPNVFYEVGIAHTLGKKVILLSQEREDLPFDFRLYRVVSYEDNTDGIEKLKAEIPKLLL